MTCQRVFSALLFLIASTAFAQNIQGMYDGYFNPNVMPHEAVSYGSVEIARGRYLFSISEGYVTTKEISPSFFVDRSYDETGTYELSRTGKIDYLVLKTNTRYQYKSKLGVIFHPRRLFLYDNNNPFFISDDGSNFMRPDRSLIRPWVESAPGDGIGEWLEITTDQFQKIRLPIIISTDTAVLRFTIVEVYKGSQWDDTCLNLIIPLGDLPGIR